ncbi:hypothetical protein [Sulfuricurvum sp.]|uniref:hypothetical protein n=1 Tax=Sulfuricurvum sp. TaxID=2025608 RepID=UPI002618AE4C|nr:hypothetical protein [Sulfuricurvum sp.]MDD2267441.1 hypothetical protein [Sulfuricurvum sp.]MDD2782837.1 hypothetical protein [Sulfuricurvum sp.]
MKPKTQDLKELAKYAKCHGYTVEIKSDHIVAANNNGAVRTGSMETLKKVAGGGK